MELGRIDGVTTRNTPAAHQSIDGSPQLTWILAFDVDFVPLERFAFPLTKRGIVTTLRDPRSGSSRRVTRRGPMNGALELQSRAFSRTALIVEPRVRRTPMVCDGSSRNELVQKHRDLGVVELRQSIDVERGPGIGLAQQRRSLWTWMTQLGQLVSAASVDYH